VRLGIDARRLEGQRLGVGRYIEYLLKNWRGMITPADQVQVYVRPPLNGQAMPLGDQFHMRPLRPRLTGLTWETAVLGRRAADEVDVLFCPSYTAPVGYHGPCVVATHSVNELEPGAHTWWYRFTYGWLHRRSAAKADRVIAPTEATKADIVRHYGVAPDRIAVIPQGADPAFRPLDDDALVRATRRKYTGDERPYVLFAGKLSRRRNIPLLMDAFALLKKRTGLPHRLLLFGPNHLGLPLAERAAELGISDSFVQTDGRVASHGELVAVYNAADLYVFASLHEGFSMTTVEAMACGLPVVAADCPALREVVGTCGWLVERPDADRLADAMAAVLTDAALSREMRRGSLRRAQDFRWDDVARRTLDVLRQVAGGERPRE
jgi:glycosyltransferase involved in cell wall biosynthesis